MKKVTLYLIIMLVLPAVIRAQYFGGFGRGDASFLLPATIVIPPQFSGGVGGGDMSISLNGKYFSNWFITSGNWSTAGNWSDAVLPSSSENANISAAAVVDGDYSYPALTISPNGSVTISPGKSFTVSGTLTNDAGNTGLVIKSDATGTGSLIHNTNTVPATVERYITGSTLLTDNYYHQVSIPLLQSGDIIAGLFSGSYLFEYNEAETPGNAWTPLGADINTPLQVNKGYLIYYPGESKTYSFSGAINSGDFNIPISYTGVSNGFNLVPNPYPSAIDWDAANGWSRSVLGGSIWIWKQSACNYTSYINGGGTNGGSNIIPVGQAFFVRATTGGTLAMNNNVRLHSNQAFLKNSLIVENNLRLKAEANNYSDELLVRFNDQATSVYDPDWDAHKFAGLDKAPQLCSTSTDNEKLSINSLPFSSGDIIVPIDFSLNTTSEVTFTASGMQTFFTSIPIYLEDLFLNQVIDLRINPVYTFSHTLDNSSNRFQLKFSGVTAIQEQTYKAPGRVFVSNQHLYLEIPSMNKSEVIISICDALGRQFNNSKVVLNGITELPSPQAIGMYIVRVVSGNKTFVGKVVVN